jgi:rare lipoprotein A
MLKLFFTCALVWGLASSEALAFPTTYYGLGDGYGGKITASGEAMDPSAYKAAHPFLPLGTSLTVCYDGCVDVVINDRGPTLDLTPAAAEAIGMMEEGRVDAEVIVH